MVQQKLITNIENIDLQASLKEEYGMNSRFMLKLVVAIERQFGFEFDDSELDLRNYENINTIVATVSKYLEKYKQFNFV